MLLTLVIILILIGSAVVGSLYSNFLTFYENFTEAENYHKARYASIAAIERAELVIKQREPGYIGSGGRKLGEYTSAGYGGSDGIVSGSGFSYLTNTSTTQNKSTIFWEINSRTDRIPATGKGNVDKLLSALDSTDYNMIDYENSEVILFFYDNKNLEKPYKKVSCSDSDQCDDSKIKTIDLTIRLPLFISGNSMGPGPLNINESLTLQGRENDPIVDRQIKGNYGGEPYTIFATQRYNTPADSAIREKDINNIASIRYGGSKWNPIIARLEDSTDTVTIISPNDDTIKTLSNKFQGLFSSSRQTELKLSLLNLLKGTNGSGMIYPFLEYYAEIEPRAGEPMILSDKYFTIQSEGNYGDYKINTTIYKPTITESILKSFTTIL